MPQDPKQLSKYNTMLDQLAGMYPEAEDEIMALQEKLADITPSDEEYEEPMEEDEMPAEEDMMAEDEESMPEMEDEEEDMMA